MVVMLSSLFIAPLGVGDLRAYIGNDEPFLLL